MKLNEKTICSGFLAVAFCFVLTLPVSFTYINGMYKIINLCRGVILAILGLLLLLELKVSLIRNKLPRLIGVPALIILYYVYLIINTYLHNGRTMYVFAHGVYFIGVALYFHFVMKNNPRTMFTYILNFLTFWVVLNCISVFLFPGGIYNSGYFDANYVLGYDNQNINFMLPTLVLVLLKHQYYKKCLPQVLFTYAVVMLTVIKVWSAMSLVMVFGMSACGVLFLRKKKSSIVNNINSGKILNMFNLLIANIGMWVALVLFNFQHYFAGFISNTLHKDVTVSGREQLWLKNLKYIKQNPVWGYGKETYAVRAQKIGCSPRSVFATHAHNRILEVLYSGGIILLSLFLGMLFYVAKKLKPVKDTLFAKIISIGIFIYLVGMLTEQYENCPFFWGLLVIAENAEDFLKKAGAQK